MPGRVSERAVGCRCVVAVVLLLAPRRDCLVSTVPLPLPPRRNRPVAIALRTTTKGRKRIPFRLRPSCSPLVGGFLFGESARHGLGRQPGRGGGVAAVAVCSRTRTARGASACVQAGNCIAVGIEHFARRANGQAGAPDARSAKPPPTAHTADRRPSRSRPTCACTGRGAWCWSCAGWQTWGNDAGSAGT